MRKGERARDMDPKIELLPGCRGPSGERRDKGSDSDKVQKQVVTRDIRG